MADERDGERKKIQRGSVNPVLPAIGVALGIVPLVGRFNQTHRSSVSTTAGGTEITHVTRKTAFDYVAVPCGAMAFVLGLVALGRGLAVRKLDVLAVVAVAFGVLQLVRGFLP